MKALVKREPAKGIWIDEVPIPSIGDHEVLIKPHKTSICGTDINIYKWDAWAQKNVPTPLVIGHEFMGEIVELGAHVPHLKVGDFVSGEGHIVCGQCERCMTGQKHLCSETKVIGIHTHGCFAEYFPLPADNVFPIPKGFDKELASVFDPLGNATHTLKSFPLQGEDVLITGAGPIGIMSVAIAKHAGARNIVITDINDYRLDMAKKAGATIALNVNQGNLLETMAEIGIKEGFTIGAEMSGSLNALTTLLHAMQPGGKIGLLGILPPNSPIDWDLVIFKMLTIKGIYGREIFKTWFQMCRMLQSGLDISSVITHRFPYQDYQKGFDAMLSGQCGKVLLDWTEPKAESIPPIEISEEEIA